MKERGEKEGGKERGKEKVKLKNHEFFSRTGKKATFPKLQGVEEQPLW